MSSIQKSNHIILLIDSSLDINQIKDFVEQKTLTIITFDYESHKILFNNNIIHEISDNYISELDLENIQKKSYILSSWFVEPTISKLIEYEGINLGQLLEIEFTYFLVRFLKKFLELVQIYKKYSDAKFVSSSGLYDIISSMTTDVKKLESNRQANTFYYDSIKVNLKISNKSITLNLPRSYYIKLKESSEKIFHFLFSPKLNQSLSKKTILLVEFDAIRFKRFFLSFPESSLNVILYNRRRPSIWNLTSFSIIKNSKCNMATSYALRDRDVNTLINNDISIVERKINSLLEHENYFKSFFSINGLSFWHIMKPTFMELFKKRIKEYVTEIVLAKQLLKKYKLSSIVVWSEVGSTERIVINLAKLQKIPIVLIQHGIFYNTQEAYDMNQSQGVFPSKVDKYIVWGKLEERHAIQYGVKPEKIEALGSPQYDQFANLNTNSKNDLILIATSGFNKEDVRGLTVKINEQYEETMKKICKIASKMNKKIVIKLHPSPDELDMNELAKEIDPNISIIKAGSISSLINLCDVLIMIDLTSVVLEAELYRKPIISISVKNWWGTPEIFRSKACISTNVNELESLLNQVLNDEGFRRELIENGKKFVDEYLSNQGTASKRILEFLNSI